MTNTPVFSANTTLEKSTIFMRDNETVVDPHSMSAVPSTIATNRVRVSTGTPFYREGNVQLRFKRFCNILAEFDGIASRPPLRVNI